MHPVEELEKPKVVEPEKPKVSELRPAGRMKIRLEVYRDRGKQYRWRLRGLNNKIMADSGEGYHNKQDCVDAIDGILDAEVVERSVAG